MRVKTLTSYSVDLYLAGDHAQAKQVCREYCYRVGLCVHLHPIDFIYTGGEETGIKIGLVNYPRFPSTPEDIWARAEELAHLLLDRLCQHSVLLQSPDRVTWITRREQG